MPPSSSATTSSRGSTPSPNDDEDLLEVAEPGFLNPPARAADDPLPTIEGETSDPSGWDGGSDVEPDGPSDGPTTSTGPRGRSSTASIDVPGVEELARTVVGLASLLVRAVRARRRPDLPPDAWIADDQDQAAIGDPLARIAARHAPVGNGPTGDMVDGLAVMVGATGYTLKGIQLEAAVDQLAAQTPDLGAQEPG